MNGNAHEHDPLFDDATTAPLTNGDSHSVELKPDVTTKLSIVDTVAPVAEVTPTTSPPPQLPSENAVTAVAITETTEEPLATTSVPPSIEQPTSDVRDETPLEPAPISSSSPPADTTEHATVEAAHEDKMDTQSDTAVAEQDPLATTGDSAMIESTSEATQQEPTPIEAPATTADTDMADAPESDTRASNLVRQREDFGEEENEPNAKRLKLDTTDGGADGEFKVPEVPASATTTDYGTPVVATGDDPYSRPIDDQPITKVQTKFLIDAIKRTKKTKAAKPFLVPVDAKVLNLPTYYAVITKPMDLNSMELKLKDGKYTSVNDVLADMNQIVENTVTFNGRVHQVTTDGINMRASFVKTVQSIPTGEKAREEEVKKAPPPKPAPVRRESRAQARSPTNKASETHQSYLDPLGNPLIRRDSTNTDRPKREIHKPPPRDIPYTVRPNKKNKVELKFCETVLQEMLKSRYNSIRQPFDYPVDPVALNIPNYFKVIKNPMDLSTLQKNLKSGAYQSAKDFFNDMKLIFHNCFKFNPPNDGVFVMGKSLEEVFDKLWAGKKEYMSTHGRESEPPSSDDDEGSDEDAEDEEDDAPKMDETQKRMVEIQKQIAALNAEAMALAQGQTQARAEDKKSKKAAKTAKAPKAGGAGKIKRQNSAPSLTKTAKEKPAKRQPKKWKKLNLEQKRQVSEGIGMLDENHMRKAVQIIRNGVPHLKDVHDDELELDIDEIPDEVVYELWEFVRKLQPRSQVGVDEDDDYEEERGPKAAAAAGAHRKKNKPMTAREQESKIAQVREQMARFEGQSPVESPAAEQDESSDDDAGSDESSEEE